MKTHPLLLPATCAALTHLFITTDALVLPRRPRALSTALFAQAGTFFNPVPNDDDDDDESDDSFQDNLSELLRQRQSPPRASEPSTIRGIPTAKVKGFGPAKAQRVTPKNDKPFIGIGPPLNDITAPEVDDQGYTLYADERTGQRSRVFEALVDYPCEFTMKIVGANEGTFVEEMVAVVAESCRVEIAAIRHSVRENGKWTSLTVEAPVQSAEMLYALYEKVDRDPRVKFKF